MNSIDVKVQKQQRHFFLLLAGAGVAIAALQFVKDRPEVALYALVAAVFFMLIEFAMPPLGRLVFKGWMAFAKLLGFVNTFILVSLVYFLFITPVGLIRRRYLKSSEYSPESCRQKKSAWFPLTDAHRYSAPY